MLRQTLARDDRHLGMAIKSMDIHIQMFSGNPNVSLVGFFQLTPCLKHLTLVTTITGEQDHFDKLRVSELGQMLRNVKDTLETLVLSIGLVSMCLDGSPLGGGRDETIGSLCDFRQLKRLTIQSHVLLGNPEIWKGFTNLPSSPPTKVSQLLPVNLEDLTIYYYYEGFVYKQEDFETQRYVHHVHQDAEKPCGYRRFNILHSPRAPAMRRVLGRLVVCLPKIPDYSRFHSFHFRRLKDCLDVVGTQNQSSLQICGQFIIKQDWNGDNVWVLADHDASEA